MSDKQDEMSDAELDALLGDLSSRAESAPAASAGDDEDIEAFLAQLEGDDYEPPPATTSDDKPDPLTEQFAGIEEAPENAEMVPAEEKSPEPKKSRKEKKEEKQKAKKAKKEGVAVVEKEGSQGLKTFLVVAKWSLLLLPVVTAAWIVGAYLAAWVSAGWLIAVMALVAVLGLPGLAVLAAKRGRYVYWLSGLALVLTVGLVAPLANPAANAIARHGHWPMTAVTNAAGLDADNWGSTFAGWVSEKVAGLLVGPTATVPVAAQLGSETPLDGAAADTGDEPVAPDAEESADDTTKPEPEPKADDSTEPSEKPAPEAAPSGAEGEGGGAN
jgi:hypothetical protein